MIVELLRGLVFGSIRRGLVLAAWPPRSAPPGRAAPPQVVFSSGAMSARLALYEAWAAAHGLERRSLRGAELAGSYRGRSTEMVTGLLDVTRPRSPQLLIRIGLPGIPRTTLLERGPDAPRVEGSLQALTTLLDIEGVHDLGATAYFVRIRFDPFVATSVFDAALEAFEHVLAALPPHQTCLVERARSSAASR